MTEQHCYAGFSEVELPVGNYDLGLGVSLRATYAHLMAPHMMAFICASGTGQAASAAGAALFTLGGLAAAFGLASWCALPLLLTTVGVGSAWLGEWLMAALHRGALLAVGALCLLGGAAPLWRQQQATATCGANGVCTPPAVRVLTLAGLLIGGALLWAGYTYV